MTEQIGKLLNLACEALALYIRKTTLELGEALPLPLPEAPKPAKERKPRALKVEAPAPAAARDKQHAMSAPHASVEEQVEAARRCKEVIGLFIRARLTAKPSGVEQATAIIKRELGAPRKSYDVRGTLTPMWKLEDFTYEENLKLIPVFEKADEKVAA